MTTARHRHRGASYVASASDGIIKTSHKVYASSSDDDSPAGFLQSAYNSPPASPRCEPRRQVTYSVTESEEDVSESPDAFVVELTRSDNFWTQRVRWYPDNCFGPYRAERLGYSRRELCADAVVHLVGIVAFSAGAGALLHACCVHAPPVETTVSLLLYVCSLLTMLGCSFAFNGAAWSRRHLWALQLADHLGIHSLITGTATALLVHADAFYALVAVWLLALASVLIKALRCSWDVLELHIPIFLLQGCVVVLGCVASDVALSPWALRRVVAGGLCYACGLAVAGSFSRSAVNVVTGGSSQLSSIVTAGAVVLTLLFFTGCFERVPKAVLGSILIYAVSGLVDVKRVKALASSDKRGLMKWLVFFGLMMALGPAEGLVASVAVDAALGLVG